MPPALRPANVSRTHVDDAVIVGRATAMIEYRWLHATHRSFVDTLEQAVFLEPGITALQQDATAAVRGEPAAALLGTFVHEVIAHATDDGWELDLLERASSTWRRGRNLADRLAAIRAALEASLEDPSSPGAAQAFNQATVHLQELANDAIAVRGDVDAIRADALTMQHLPPHPRQGDRDIRQWGWGDRVAARRTDAFVRSLHRHADPSNTKTVALAVAATGAYGAHAAGSAYLSHVVGGPRRAHRYRDRLGSHSIGSWVSAHAPAGETLSDLASTLEGVLVGGGLDADLDALVTAALHEAYDVGNAAPPLATGVARVIRHLRLLDGFDMPSVPAPPGAVWMQLAWGDPGNPPPHLTPQDLDLVGTDDGPVVQVGPPETGSQQPGKSDSSGAAGVCGVIALILVVADLVQAFVRCVVQWAEGDTCTFWDNMFLKKLFEQDPPDPTDQREVEDLQTTAQELTVIASAPQVTQLIMLLSDLHTQVYETMARARTFLAITGLIAPETTESLPVYEQFLRIAVEPSGAHLEEPDARSTYHRYPSSPIEEPSATPSPYPWDATPAAVQDSNSEFNANSIALTLWAQVAHGIDGHTNLDLDADRGFGHAAWEAVGSVHDAPVAVRILDYTEE